MIDAEPQPNPLRLPGRARRSATPRHERLARSTTLWRITDALLAIVILTTLVVAGNLGRMPDGVTEFLAYRVSVKNLLLLTAFGLAWPSILSMCGLYAPAHLRTGKGDLAPYLLAGTFGCGLALIFPLTSRSGAVRIEQALLFPLAIVPLSLLARSAIRTLKRMSRGTHKRQIVIVGSGPLAARMHSTLTGDPFGANAVIGFVDSDPHAALATAGPAHLGGLPDLEEILMHRVVDDVLIGLPIKSRYEEIQRALSACARVGVPARYPADLFRGTPDAWPSDTRSSPMAFSVLVPADDRPRIIKRAIDIIGAAVLLTVLAPLMVAITIAVKLTSTGPVIFAQERYGYMKRRFRMYKFRTMVANAERLQASLETRNEAVGPAFKIREDPRRTRIGAFLRRTSLDELPQLWNVLFGQMSLVGPRPMSLRDVQRFIEPWLMKRFSVPPGLTGLWQVSDRSNLSFDQWIGLDLTYIDNWSLLLDIRILLQTVPAVFLGKGAA